MTGRRQTLARRAPVRALACGAWLKNAACLIDGAQVIWSEPHGDLSTPEACSALRSSVERLLAEASGPVHAVAHDLHPDFESTRLALVLADRLGVPAIGVQHHHAHIAAVMADHGRSDAVIGLALDGFGLGADGSAWGGEVLRVRASDFQRQAHLPALAQPGGDQAAREPWRMAAAALHAVGRGNEIAGRFTAAVGEPTARALARMLDQDVRCPPSTSAGRWFDAAAGLLGLRVRQEHEAQAAQELEAAACAWLDRHPAPRVAPAPLDAPRGLVEELLAYDHAPGEGAARFHLRLAAGLAESAIAAAHLENCNAVAIGGGCWFNRILRTQVVAAVEAAGLEALTPLGGNFGDAGIALGQAWVAAHRMAGRHETPPIDMAPDRRRSCA